MNSSHSPAAVEPIAIAVKAAKPLPVPNHVLFLQQRVMNQKSRLLKTDFTCISCCSRRQAFLLAWVFKRNHLKRADTPQWCWNCLFSWSTSIASTTSITPNELLIYTLIQNNLLNVIYLEVTENTKPKRNHCFSSSAKSPLCSFLTILHYQFHSSCLN